MTRTAEQANPVNVPQPGNIEDLLIPGDYAKRFKTITKMTKGDNAPYPHAIAAAVLDDEYGKRDNDEVAVHASELANADDYIRANPGMTIVNINHVSLDAGRVADGSALTFRNSPVESFVSPWGVVATQSDYSAHLGATGASRFNAGEFGDEIKKNEGRLDFMVAPRTVTPDSPKSAVEEAIKGFHDGGALIIGETAVSNYFASMAERELGDGIRNRGVNEYEHSIALLGIAALKRQGSELTVGRASDLVHQIGVDILARMVAKGLGDCYGQSELGHMANIARRLPAADFTVADLAPISTRALQLTKETENPELDSSRYSALTELATCNGGTVEEVAKDHATSLLKNLMGVSLK